MSEHNLVYIYKIIRCNASRISFNFLRLAFSRDSVDSVVCKQLPGQVGVRILAVCKYFFFSKSSTSLRPPSQSPIQWMAGLFPDRKVVFVSPFSSAEAKNEWSYNSTSLYMLSWRGDGHSFNAPVLSIFFEPFYIMRVEDFILLLVVIWNFKELDTSVEITNKMQPCNGIYYSTVH
jgi:hypothetical protein